MDRRIVATYDYTNESGELLYQVVRYEPKDFRQRHWLHELGLQEFGLSIRLVKASELPVNTCGMSNFDVKSLIGEIDVLRSDEWSSRDRDNRGFPPAEPAARRSRNRDP